jgi:UDP-N-acetylmuramyl pentapeptide phosphotransferase/UDP-N-acetylglucosamine-1-phosphate transferase
LLKWLLTIVIALLLLGVLIPWLRRRGLRRIPGDITITRRGQQYYFPIGSTIMLSLLASLLYWMLR